MAKEIMSCRKQNCSDKTFDKLLYYCLCAGCCVFHFVSCSAKGFRFVLATEVHLVVPLLGCSFVIPK
jgi:hypothetical protein